MKVGEVDVLVEGDGAKCIVMVHGWPDTHRLWDPQVAALKDRYRCIRFTLPGFDLSRPARAYSLDEVVETIHGVVTQTSDGSRVTLLVHDWGCLYGYQFAMQYPQLVERIVGVDIGDAGSRRNRAEIGARGTLMILAYQLWLALAWRIGGSVGNAMARRMARFMRCPVEPQNIGAQMGYPYAVRWLGVAGGFRGLRVFRPEVPMLYFYGERKPFMFQSRAWMELLAGKPANRVLGFPTGHWVMLGRPREFNDALRSWLQATDQEATA